MLVDVTSKCTDLDGVSAAGAEPEGQHLLSNSQAPACANWRLCIPPLPCACLLQRHNTPCNSLLPPLKSVTLDGTAKEERHVSAWRRRVSRRSLVEPWQCWSAVWNMLREKHDLAHLAVQVCAGLGWLYQLAMFAGSVMTAGHQRAPVDVPDKGQGTPPADGTEHEEERQAHRAVVQEEERALHGPGPAALSNA